ncbi:MAG: SoxR reducing system RseC family protein [Methylophagaceae bacterium]
MIKQQATVVSYDENTVWLEAERQSTCDGCQVKKGCGTGLLAKHVGKRFSRIAVAKTMDVHIGQQVQLAIPEESLLQGALLMYILPLVMMFAFSAIAQTLNINEALEIIAGISGLLIGFYWVRNRLQGQTDGLQAKIVEE